LSSLEEGFQAFAHYAMARRGQRLAPHQQLLVQRLQEVADGDCDRLMVQMPPGYAKSTYGSVLFPAYFMARQQRAQVIATAHTASLAHYFGRHVRAAIEEHAAWLGIGLAKTSKGTTSFSSDCGGEYFSAGVRGPITGRRADLVIIDDPVKSWAEAESLVARDALYDWYRAELSARLKPEGRVVLIMTRWHEDDLAGRLLAREGRWSCLRLPAMAGAEDALGRAPGDVLWPEMFGREAIERRRLEVGERAFAAMYQQMPQAPAARLFCVEKIGVVAEVPDVTKVVRAWDLAASWA